MRVVANDYCRHYYIIIRCTIIIVIRRETHAMANAHTRVMSAPRGVRGAAGGTREGSRIVAERIIRFEYYIDEAAERIKIKNNQ